MKYDDSIVAPLLLVAALAMAEYALIRRRARGSWDWRESGASLVISVGYQFLAPLGTLLWSGLYQWVWARRLVTVPLDGVSGVAALVLGVEFFYYWYHRASHEVRWFWASHAVHHSVEHLNLTAAYRLGWTSTAAGAGLFFLPMVWLGFEPRAVFGVLAANLVYQLFLHTEQIGRLGPLEWILNTPSHHRVHHGSNAGYLDANYGGILIVFDRMFGTFVPEREDVPCRYGLVVPVGSNHPLRIVFHEWGRMLRDLRNARSLRQASAALFARPAAAQPPQAE